MAKWQNDLGLDAALDYFAASTILHVCSAQSANYAGIAALSLGSVAVDSGDFAKADGDTSGRKLTIAAQSITAASASNAGTTLHAVLASTGDSTLRYVTTIPSQAITSRNPINVGSWKIEIADPS